MATSFKDLLSKSASSAERPKPLPAGMYEFQIIDVGKLDKTRGNPENPGGTALIRYPLQVLKAVDVPASELEKFGEVRGRRQTMDFFITDDAIYRHSDFAKACKLADTMSHEQIMTQAKGAVVWGIVSHQPSNKPGDDTIYARITKILPAS